MFYISEIYYLSCLDMACKNDYGLITNISRCNKAAKAFVEAGEEFSGWPTEADGNFDGFTKENNFPAGCYWSRRGGRTTLWFNPFGKEGQGFTGAQDCQRLCIKQSRYIFLTFIIIIKMAA